MNATNSHYEDDFVTETEFHTCPYHRLNPSGVYHGCTCNGSYRQRRATPEEKERNRKNREERERKHVETLAKLHGLG